ncbi:hypothetical protein ACTIVE_0392 [Actinomadura verrucosospora]|uniref:PatG C-terminal domain-containing protein n=2 Tax=Actinomadura verrucosospora TaxID=46165 RepID=A0A7D3VS23_ACTVE|nr:hypothetical protein ACTIVE_0392 [Actinomadura verrucosospora]
MAENATAGEPVQQDMVIPDIQEPAVSIVGADGCGCGGTEGSCSCGGGAGAAAPESVYAIGTVTARFPSLNLEKEFMQAWGKNPEQTLTVGDADKFAVLSQGQNLYLAREMCWVFQSGDIDLYVLQPRSYVELTGLVTALSPAPGQVSFALVIGTLGPIAPPGMCNGAQLPIVTCNQVFGFTGQAFINSITAEVTGDGDLMRKISDHLAGAGGGTGQTPEEYVAAAAGNAFSALTLLSDNAGQTDEHRAINYLTFKSLALYKKEIEMELNGFTLNSVQAHPDALSGGRRIQDVILLYASTTTTQIQRYFTRIDVSGQFPFMVNDLSLYYDHP